MFYSLESILRGKQNNTGRTRQKRRVEFLTIKTYFIKASVFIDVQKGLLKSRSPEKRRSLDMGEKIPLEKDRNRTFVRRKFL